MISAAGDAESVKFGAGFTVRDTEVVLVRLPEVPTMVALIVPVAAVLLIASVKVLLLVVLAGLNEAVIPLGSPEAERLTLSLKPFCGAMVIVLVPLAPCTMLKFAGEADRKKLGLDPGQLFTKF